MDLINKRVSHKSFGRGTVVQIGKTSITVHFDDVGDKKFAYPDCFKSFLKLENEADHRAVQTDVRAKEFERRSKEAHEKKEEQSIQEYRAKYSSGQLTGKARTTVRKIVVKEAKNPKEFFDTYTNSLKSEIAHIRMNGGKKISLFEGVFLSAVGNTFLYSFESETELNYPAGTQIRLWKGEDNYYGSIVGCESFNIVISSSVDLGTTVPAVEFTADPWRIMNSLVERLEEIRVKPSSIVNKLTCKGHQAIETDNHNIITGQDNAVRMSVSQPITFIWGPPGTGKTHTLAKIALTHMKQNHRVLMVSYSNVSVDGAILRVHKMGDNLKPGDIVRYGYSRVQEILDHDYISSYKLALYKNPALKRNHDDLISERKRLSRNSLRYLQISKELTTLRNSIMFEEKNAVEKAKFVATTVSKAQVDKIIYDGNFDVVIFDEASMAYIPQVVFSAGLAKQHFICMGDFRQLPPIVQGEKSTSLKADIFDYCGITKAVDMKCNHRWLCMLDVQYRMHPSISDFASFYMYGSLLKSHESMEAVREGIALSEPLSSRALGLADLSGMMSVCTRSADNSHFNVLSAFASASLALQSADKLEVGIITPYSSQARLLHAIARDIEETNSDLNKIECATVHQFQGSEKDMIIYDAVDCYRIPYPGMLLTSSENNQANRLFNVALTRAKGKFVAVANVDYMNKKGLPSKLMFRKIVETQTQSGRCVKGNQVFVENTVSDKSGVTFYTKEDAIAEYLRDLSSAKKEVYIDIPNMPVDDQYLSKLVNALSRLKDQKIKVSVRVESKKNLPDIIKPLAIENTFVTNPVSIIDKNIVWFGMPLSNASFQIDGKIVVTKYRPIIRFTGTHTSRFLYSLLDMSNTSDQSTEAEVNKDGTLVTDNFANYVLANKDCPSCGRPMRLQKSKSGKFFFGCTGYPNCTDTCLIDADFVDDYIYRHGSKGQRCPKCNCSLEAKIGQYGLYVRCLNSRPHNLRLDEI